MANVRDTGRVVGVRVDLALGLGLMALVGLSACTGHHRLYPGPARPKDQIATLVSAPQAIPPGMGGVPYWSGQAAPLRIIELDGRRGPARSSRDDSVEIELLPGTHELRVILDTAEWLPYSRWQVWVSSPRPVALKFVAEAGHVYAVRAYFRGPTWTARILDLTENFRIVGVPSP